MMYPVDHRKPLGGTVLKMLAYLYKLRPRKYRHLR